MMSRSVPPHQRCSADPPRDKMIALAKSSRASHMIGLLHRNKKIVKAWIG
jgi:hypothetical protein